VIHEVSFKLIIFLPQNVIPCCFDVVIHILCVPIFMFKQNIKGCKPWNIIPIEKIWYNGNIVIQNRPWPSPLLHITYR
jgi:hypothetical protein